jgi:hypothetical protein
VPNGDIKTGYRLPGWRGVRQLRHRPHRSAGKCPDLAFLVRRRSARGRRYWPCGGPKGGLAKKTIGKLLTDGLVEEVPAGGMLPVWRRDEKGQRVAGSATSFREGRGGW